MRDFSGFDANVGNQLWLLKQQSESAPLGGPEQLQVLTGRALSLAEMLPQFVRALIPTYRCVIGGSRWDQPARWCHAVWLNITADLRAGQSRVKAQRHARFAQPDCLAERLVTAVGQVPELGRQSCQFGFHPTIARQIEHIAAGHALAQRLHHR